MYQATSVHSYALHAQITISMKYIYLSARRRHVYSRHMLRRGVEARVRGGPLAVVAVTRYCIHLWRVDPRCGGAGRGRGGLRHSVVVERGWLARCRTGQRINDRTTERCDVRAVRYKQPGRDARERPETPGLCRVRRAFRLRGVCPPGHAWPHVLIPCRLRSTPRRQLGSKNGH